MKTKNKTDKNKQLLTKRIKVEHFNSRLFNTFKTFATMKYFLFERLNALCKTVTNKRFVGLTLYFRLDFRAKISGKLVSTMQIFEYLNEI